MLKSDPSQGYGENKVTCKESRQLPAAKTARSIYRVLTLEYITWISLINLNSYLDYILNANNLFPNNLIYISLL